MNYLDFAQSLLIAEAVTNTDVETLLLSPRIELLDLAAGEVSQEELTRWVEIHLSKVSGG